MSEQEQTNNDNTGASVEEPLSPGQVVNFATRLYTEIQEFISFVGDTGQQDLGELFVPLLRALDPIPGQVSAITGDKQCHIRWHICKPYEEFKGDTNPDLVIDTCALTGVKIWRNTDEETLATAEPSTMLTQHVSITAALEEVGIPFEESGAAHFAMYVAEMDHGSEAQVAKMKEEEGWEVTLEGARKMVQQFRDKGYIAADTDLSEWTKGRQLQKRIQELGGKFMETMNTLNPEEDTSSSEEEALAEATKVLTNN